LKQLFFLLSFLAFTTIQGQFLEFGGSIGSFSYSGDLNRYPRPSESRLGFGAIYRMNFSPVLSVKMSLNYGKVAGNDNKPVDALGVSRRYSFEHQIFEFNSVFEFHFLDYRGDQTDLKWSPYAFMGVGFVKVNGVAPTLEDFNTIQFVLPMGAGVKYLIGKQFTLAAEFGVRKTFFDYLDGVSEGDIYIKDYQFGNPNDNDWYFFTGFSLTYVLYKIPCPFPYIPNKSILMRIRSN
jgi:opacity protein-like surface antigen